MAQYCIRQSYTRCYGYSNSYGSYRNTKALEWANCNSVAPDRSRKQFFDRLIPKRLALTSTWS